MGKKRPAWRCLLALVLMSGADLFGQHSSAQNEPIKGPNEYADPLDSIVKDAIDFTKPEVAPRGAGADLIEALKLSEMGQYEPALAKVRAVLQQQPNFAAAEEVMGMVLVQQGKVDEGRGHLERAIQLNPKQASAVTKIGDILLAKGEREPARAKFQEALAIDPAERHAHQRLGMLEEEDGNDHEAITHYEKGLVGTPQNYLGVKVDLARLYSRYGQHQLAVDLLTPVLTDEVKLSRAHMILGTAWLGLGDNKQALHSFELAKKYAAHPETALYATSIAYLRAGEKEKARQEAEAALAAKPGWAQAEFQLAETLMALDKIDEALAAFNRAKTADPAMRTAIDNRIGVLLAAHGQMDRGIQHLQAMISSNTADLRTYISLAELLQRSDRLPEARVLLIETNAKFPQNPLAKYSLGMQYGLERNYDAAILTLHEARDLAPKDPRVQKAISLVEYRRSNLEAAITEARKLLKMVPASIEDLFYLASLLEQANQGPEAESIYEFILQNSPDHVGSLNNLAAIRLKNNRPKDALERAEKAARLAPDNPLVLDTLGWIQFSTGNFADAVKTLEKANAVSSSPTHRYHLAAAYAQQGSVKEALARLDQALKDNAPFPERSDAVKLAEQLRKR